MFIFSKLRSSNTLPSVFLLATVLLAFGYEIFSFNLTIDEEVFGGTTSLGIARAWVQEGRWSMAAVSFILPNSTVPVVPIALGVTLMSFSLWQFASLLLNFRSKWPVFFATAIAVTYPALALTFSFSTLALGVGVGFLFLAIYFSCLLNYSRLKFILAILAGAVAVGIYDTFAAALLAISLAGILFSPSWRSALKWIFGLIGSVVLSKLIGIFVGIILSAPSSGYVSGYFDFAGLLSDPKGRIKEAVVNAWELISLPAAKFELTTPWLVAGVLLAGTVFLSHILRSNESFSVKFLKISALIALGAIPILSESLSPYSVPLRSLVFMPIILVTLFGFVLQILMNSKLTISKVVSAVLVTIMSLGTIAQAVVTNRLFSAAEYSFNNDQDLAFLIGMQKDILFPDSTQTDVPTLVLGLHSWPDSDITPARETLGVSFFALNEQRAIAFLRSQGVKVSAVPEREAVIAELGIENSPKYPQPGWAQNINGILVLNFNQ